MPKRIDLTGKKFGRLVVERRIGPDFRFQIIWEVRCSCGKVKTISTSRLTAGTTVSCGCYRDEKKIKHGGSNWPEYQVWYSMVRRCRDKRCKGYKIYGARGIKVCDRWADEFSNFISDMGRRPSSKMTIERKDNDGDYCPDNCTWATRLAQGRNTRKNRLITYKEKTKCLSEWAQIFGMKSGTLNRRLKYGWSIESALETPVKKTPRWHDV